MWTLHCIHTLAKNDLDIIWYESKLEVGWHLGFLFVEWGGLRGVMGWWGRLDRRLAMWVGGAGWLPGSNSSPLSGTIQRPQIPSWDPMPPPRIHIQTNTYKYRKNLNVFPPSPPPPKMPSFVPSHTALPFAWHSGTCPKARIYVPVDIWECHKWTKSTKTSRPKRRPGKFMCVCLNLQVVTGGQKSCPPRGRLNHKVFGEKSNDTILNTKHLSIGALVIADISH